MYAKSMQCMQRMQCMQCMLMYANLPECAMYAKICL